MNLARACLLVVSALVASISNQNPTHPKIKDAYQMINAGIPATIVLERFMDVPETTEVNEVHGVHGTPKTQLELLVNGRCAQIKHPQIADYITRARAFV